VKINPACILCCLAIIVVAAVSGCSVEASKAEAPENAAPTVSNRVGKEVPPGAVIEIKPGSPSETVRAFYTKLRERKIREAIFLTNLRPAIEGLTDDELKEFAVDFEAVAANVPAEVEINGEIISGDSATVTAKLPNEDGDKIELQEIRLRREGEIWIILSADDATETRIKKEKKNYFLALRIETHEKEAKRMLDRIAKAEMVHSLQNNGEFAEIGKLIELGYLPADITTSETTGYNYSVKLSEDRKSYSASATPAVYGKSGKLSFMLDLDADGKPRMKSLDNGGKVLDK
jgi:hypothetical protein